MFDSLKVLKPELRERTYEKGFTCRFVFYIKYTSLFFVVVAGGTLVATKLSGHFWGASPRPAANLTAQYFYLCSNLLIFIAVSVLNRPNLNNPTGCWAMWRDISAQHVLRLTREFEAIEKKVCDRHSPSAPNYVALNPASGDQRITPPDRRAVDRGQSPASGT